MNRIVKTVYAVLFTLSVFVFLAFFYRGHIRNAEYGGIFLYTLDFLSQALSKPGGFGGYVLDFIRQFFHIPILGAALISLLLLTDSLLVALLCRSRTTMSFLLSFLPATAIVFYACKFGCSTSVLIPAVVMFGSLSAASLFKKSPFPVHVFVIPFLYYLFGPLSFIYVFALIPSGKLSSVLTAFAVYLLCAGLSYFLYCPLPGSALLGIEFQSQANAASTLLPRIVPFAIAAAVMFLPCFMEGLSAIVVLPTSIVCYSLLILSMVLCSKPRVERVLRYDMLLQKGNWNGILAMSRAKKPAFYEEVCCTDLALAMRGKLADELFEFPQGGPMAMVPPYSNSISPLYSAEVLRLLGLFPPAQRYAFEAQAGTSVAEANARCYKMLAEINAALGFQAVARKYADRLSNTLFYRRWATGFDASEKLECLSDSLNHRVFYYDGNFGNVVADCLRADPDNAVAREYMLCWYILANDLDSFAANFNSRDYSEVPRLYQEAYALYWAQKHDDFIGIPSFVSKDVVSGLLEFANLRSKGRDAVKKKFSKTCWYYVFYTSASVK